MIGRNINTRSSADLSAQYVLQSSEANHALKQKK